MAVYRRRDWLYRGKTLKENFDSAFTDLIGNEGGYSNNPTDPGGETMWGITKRVALKHDYHGEMRLLPIEIAKAIAKAEYWDVAGCDELPDKLDFQVFDAAYNSGPSRACEWLESSGLVRSARPGTMPLTFVWQTPDDTDKAIMRFDAQRLLFLDSLPTWPNFGKGWARRIAENLLRAAN